MLTESGIQPSSNAIQTLEGVVASFSGKNSFQPRQG